MRVSQLFERATTLRGASRTEARSRLLEREIVLVESAAAHAARANRRRVEARGLRRITAAYERANANWQELTAFKRGEEPTRENIQKIVKAWEFARRVHFWEKRDSGEDYLNHCERVALKIAKKGGSCDDIRTGLLHDTVEAKDEKGVNKASFFQLSKLFGATVAHRVALLTKPKWTGREWVDATHPSYRRLKDKYGKKNRWNGKRWLAPGAKGYEKCGEVPSMSFEKDRVYYSRLFASGDLRALAVKFEDTADNLETLDFVSGQKRERKLVATARFLLWVAWRLDRQVFEEQKRILRRQGLSKHKLSGLLEEIKPKPVATPVVVMPPRIILDENYLKELPAAGRRNVAFIYSHANHLFCRDRIEVEVRLGRDVLAELQQAFPKLTIKRGRSLLMARQAGGGDCEFYVITGFRPRIVGGYVKMTGRGMKRRFEIDHDGKTVRVNALGLHNLHLERMVPKRHWAATLRAYMDFQEKFTELFVKMRDAENGNAKT